MSSKFIAGLRLAALVSAQVLALVPAATNAQEARPPDPPVERVLGSSGTAATAPVGHRQPRAADIPAEVPKNELGQRIDRTNRALDRQLQICRGC